MPTRGLPYHCLKRMMTSLWRVTPVVPAMRTTRDSWSRADAWYAQIGLAAQIMKARMDLAIGPVLIFRTTTVWLSRLSEEHLLEGQEVQEGVILKNRYESKKSCKKSRPLVGILCQNQPEKLFKTVFQLHVWAQKTILTHLMLIVGISLDKLSCHSGDYQISQWIIILCYLNLETSWINRCSYKMVNRLL